MKSCKRRPVNQLFSLGLICVMFAAATHARTAMTFYLAGIRGGDVQSTIYPRGGPNPPAGFFYVELTQRF